MTASFAVQQTQNSYCADPYDSVPKQKKADDYLLHCASAYQQNLTFLSRPAQMALSESCQMTIEKSTHRTVNSSLYSCRHCVHAV